MGYNKIPLALKFNDNTGNAEGLIEFEINLSDAGDVCTEAPTEGQVLAYNSEDGKYCPSTVETGGGGGTPTLPGGSNGDLLINTGGGTTYLASAASDVGLVTSVNSQSPTGGNVSLNVNQINAANGTSFSTGSLNVTTQNIAVGTGVTTTTIYPTGYINLPNITAATTLTEEGDVGYDQDSNTFAANVGSQDLIIHMGEDQVIQTYNDTGAAIGSGLAVYVSGSVGDRLVITLADKDTDQETQRILGVTTRQIADATQGFIQTFGKLELDTRNIVGAVADNEGDPVFLGDNGALTITKPTLPTESVIRIGKLEKYAEDGLLFIDVQHGFVANDLDDVNVDINSVMITNGASAVSSLSGASGSMVYFDGGTPAPILRTFDNIVSHEGYTIQPGETYLTGIGDSAVGTDQIADDAVTADKLADSINSEIADNTAKVTNATHTGQVTGSTSLTIADDVVDPDNLADTGITNGQLIKRSSATQFAGVTTTANSETFLGTQANLGDLTNVNANDVSDGHILEYNSASDPPWVAVSPGEGFFTNNGILNTFHTSGGDPLVRLDASDASASLTEAYTFTIPSGTLGDYKDVEIDYYGRHLNNAGTGGNLRVAFIMGGVGIFNSQTSQGTGTNPMRWHLKIKLASMTGNKYHVFLNWTQGAQSFATSGQGNIGSMHREGVMHSEATLTSTVDNDIRFEIRHESFASVTEKYFTIDSVRAVALPAVVGAE